MLLDSQKSILVCTKCGLCEYYPVCATSYDHSMKQLKRKFIYKRSDNFKAILTQALHGLAPKCKLINTHELIHKSTNDYVTLLPCKNGASVNNKG